VASRPGVSQVCHGQPLVSYEMPAPGQRPGGWPPTQEVDDMDDSDRMDPVDVELAHEAGGDEGRSSGLAAPADDRAL
jgi:hypothetical protein